MDFIYVQCESQNSRKAFARKLPESLAENRQKGYA
tara:strand:- start:329 stop:433 length:105 start_codon:yes stop_codon:yes gene_type:complete